jgi:lipase ATG15
MQCLFHIIYFLHVFAITSTVEATVPQNSVNVDLQYQFDLPLHTDVQDQLSLLIDYASPSGTPAVSLKARPMTVYRPKSLEAHEHARLRSLHQGETEPVEWEEVVVLGPDVQDRHTLSQLARMTANAYQLPGHKNWYELDASWNVNAVNISLQLLMTHHLISVFRAFHLVGITMKMDSGAMSFVLGTILRSCFQSRALLFRDPHQRRIN